MLKNIEKFEEDEMEHLKHPEHPELFKKIGERIREERKKLPKGERSLEAFATSLQISKPTLIDIEKGKANNRTLTIPLLAKMADIFGCDISYLLGEYDQFRTSGSMIASAETGLTQDALNGLKYLQVKDERAKIEYIAYLQHLQHFGKYQTELPQHYPFNLPILNVLLSNFAYFETFLQCFTIFSMDDIELTNADKTALVTRMVMELDTIRAKNKDALKEMFDSFAEIDPDTLGERPSIAKVIEIAGDKPYRL